MGRLRDADYSYYNSGWQTTSAYDLTDIDYDPSGNLLAMKRYRSAGTLIDNLTYQYTSGTNKLNYTDDAVSTTGETWDAEDGSSGAFTYDANGAMTALPAPYSVTSVTYDPRGMAVKVVASGNTTYYRYNSAGERYWKKTTSTTDYYALDGALQLGVFSSTGTLRHWNVIAGGRVVGRYDGSVKKYYHSDHLGTTRSVVEGSCTGGSCTIREARDYDAWGIELDGRTYLSGTAAIEGFTGKERDSETGLDYFGARYYMPSVGRWNAVDPVADKYPGWSPYNYVLNNPLMLVDPDGMAADKFLLKLNGEVVVQRSKGRDEYFVQMDAGSNIGRAIDFEVQKDRDLFVAAVENDASFRKEVNASVSEWAGVIPNDVAGIVGGSNVRQGGSQAFATGVEVLASSMEATAIGAAFAGPAGFPISMGANLGGTALRIGQDISEGQYGIAALRAVNAGLFGYTGHNARQVSPEIGSDILQAVNEALGWVGRFTIGNVDKSQERTTNEE